MKNGSKVINEVNLRDRVAYRVRIFLNKQPALDNISKRFEEEYLIEAITSVMQMKFKINSPKSSEDLVYKTVYMLYVKVLSDKCHEAEWLIEARINELKEIFRNFKM